MDNKYTNNTGKIIVAVVILTSFITTFTGSALNLSIPDIGREFGVSAGFVGWLITGYTLAVAAFSVPIGRVADITCRKTVLVIGIMIFIACCIAAVFSVSATMLLAARIIQGIGAAMIFGTNTAVLISAFPETMRGRVLGYSLASTYAGLSAGPVVGGILNYNMGWKSIFVLTGLLGILALVAAMLKLPGEKAEGRGKSADILGNVLYVLFISLLMYGLSELGKGLLSVFLVISGLVLGMLFVIREKKVREPAVKISMFKEDIGYAFSNLSAMMNYGATFAIGYLISIYLQVVMGYSSKTAGIIMISQPAIMAVLSPVAGRFSDKISPFKMSSVGMALCAAGTSIFIFIGQETPLVVIIVALVVTGLGFSLFSSPNTNAVMSCVEKKDYGVTSSLLATMRSIGHTLSMVVVTITVTFYMGENSLVESGAQQLIKVINTSFTVFTMVCVAGVFISLKRNKRTS